MKRVIVTHANCSDGFCAAYIARQYYMDNTQIGEAGLEFLELHYQKPENDLLEDKMRGNIVEVFDFSFPRATMQWYNRIAHSFHVWDHHKTTQAECEGLEFCTFDLTKSGAMLAWEHYYPGTMAPPLVRYVQDRDLWKWEMYDSRAVNAYIGSWERTWENWGKINEVLNRRHGEAVEAGYTLLRAQEGAVAGLVKFAKYLKIGGHNVPFLNLTGLINETLERLAKEERFAASFFLAADGAVVFSLRSAPDGMDVSEIAKAYGGGGHKHAAGFRVTLEQLVEIIRNGS